jgi:5'-methylthioadenosine phosphorylase
MRIGVIGGSGLYGFDGVAVREEISLRTPFGEPSAPFAVGDIAGREVVFLPRHGPHHRIPPHKVNYRANVWGFKELGVERLISVGAVGGITRDTPPGSLVLLDQILDMTFGARQSTFHEGDRVTHVDFTEPYCPEMRRTVLQAARGLKLKIRQRGTYVCVNGPRLETAKEIAFFSRIGGHVVGMTAMPEAVLAREVEICMVGVALVTNYAAGITPEKLTAREVVRMMQGATDRLRPLLRDVVASVPPERRCLCKDALTDATV